MSALGLFRAAGAFLVFASGVHLLRLFAPLPDSPAFALAREAMQAFSLSRFGLETNLYAIHDLLDWSIMLLSALVGALNLAAARALAASPGALRRVALVDALGLVALVVASLAHRVVPPAFFYSLAAALFAAAALRAGALP